MYANSLQSCPTLCNPIDCRPLGFSVHEDSPGKDTGVGCLALLQGIFLTQGSNPCLLCLPALADGFFTTSTTWEAYIYTYICIHIHTYIYVYIYIYIMCACVHVKLLQSCAALCDAADCSLSGSSVHGILHEKILEWVSMPSSTGSSQPRIEPYICCIHIWNWLTFLYTWHWKYNIVNQLYANNIF